MGINVIKFAYQLPAAFVVSEASYSTKPYYYSSHRNKSYSSDQMHSVLQTLFDKKRRNLFIFNYPDSILRGVGVDLKPENLLHFLGAKIKAVRSQLHKIIWPDDDTRKDLPFVGFITTISPEFLRAVRGGTQDSNSTSDIDFKDQGIILGRSKESINKDTPVIIRGFNGRREDFAKVLAWFAFNIEKLSQPQV